jgi:hypothetical protein
MSLYPDEPCVFCGKENTEDKPFILFKKSPICLSCGFLIIKPLWEIMD